MARPRKLSRQSFLKPIASKSRDMRAL